MSTLWSGSICWVVVMVSLISQSAANDAIITSMNEEGHWDVSLNITHLDLMPGLDHWDDLAFTSLQQAPWFSEFNGSMGLDLWEKMAVLDIASGSLCQYTDGCMDNIDSHYQSLCDAASQKTPAMGRRFIGKYIYKFVNRGWNLSKKHVV